VVGDRDRNDPRKPERFEPKPDTGASTFGGVAPTPERPVQLPLHLDHETRRWVHAGSPSPRDSAHAACPPSVPRPAKAFSQITTYYVGLATHGVLQSGSCRTEDIPHPGFPGQARALPDVESAPRLVR